MTPKEILSEIEINWNRGYVLGIRGDSRIFLLGDEIPSDPNLDGVCAVSVCYYPTNSIDESIAGIERALSLCGRYGGPNIYLVKGDDLDFGVIDREIILINAEIVARI